MVLAQAGHTERLVLVRVLLAADAKKSPIEQADDRGQDPLSTKASRPKSWRTRARSFGKLVAKSTVRSNFSLSRSTRH